MKINYSENKIGVKEEKLLLIGIIGILETVKRGNVSVNEAEKIFFSPHVVNQLKKRECRIEIIDILERGCELEDIASLLPQSLEKNIIELEKQTLKVMEVYPQFDDKFWIPDTE